MATDKDYRTARRALIAARIMLERGLADEALDWITQSLERLPTSDRIESTATSDDGGADE